MSNKQYWSRKDELSRKAIKHTEEMENKHKYAIQSSANRTEIFTIHTPFIYTRTDPLFNLEIKIQECDTVSAILDSKNRSYVIGSDVYQNMKMAALNFASYKNPGGMFLKGSSAQEESLCHESYLYNILSSFNEYYTQNRGNLNKGLYTNRALYTPDVLFERDGISTYCDIITCAAPNKGVAMRNGVSEFENLMELQSRIQFIIKIAEYCDADTLILGAYGCGVFKQDPYEVAQVFKETIFNRPNSISRVIFAIPGGKNLQAFHEIFNI